MTGKTKATTEGSPVEIKEIKRITNYAMSVAGGQGYQPGGRFLVAFSRRGYLSRNASSASRFGLVRGEGLSKDSRFWRAFSRWRSIMDNAIACNSSLVIVCACKAMRRNTLHHGADGDYSGSLALRRWRYSTSRFNAAVTNCPVLSPGIFTASTLFITSCGTLAATVCDFAFTAFVAMWCTPHKKQMQYAGKKISVQHLTCLTPVFKLVFNTLLAQGAETTKPGSALTLTGLLTTNDSESIEVAMRNHTTHPQGRDSHNLNKYIWRFIALSTAQPRVITIEATSEQEARQQSPAGCVMVFAAR
ncbi:host cell division inhibitor Icd-like protein, partial [Escherichia coli]